KALGCH
ncbi:unnamed protein product, partial [Allacma fusca]